MRHRQAGRKLKRTKAAREAMLKNMARDLILNEKIETTAAKAKEVQSLAEKLITLGKKGDANTKRLLVQRIGDGKTVKLLMKDLKDRYASREGGYTVMHKMGLRQGDGATMARLTLIKTK